MVKMVHFHLTLFLFLNSFIVVHSYLNVVSTHPKSKLLHQPRQCITNLYSSSSSSSNGHDSNGGNNKNNKDTENYEMDEQNRMMMKSRLESSLNNLFDMSSGTSSSFRSKSTPTSKPVSATDNNNNNIMTMDQNNNNLLYQLMKEQQQSKEATRLKKNTIIDANQFRALDDDYNTNTYDEGNGSLFSSSSASLASDDNYFAQRINLDNNNYNKRYNNRNRNGSYNNNKNTNTKNNFTNNQQQIMNELSFIEQNSIPRIPDEYLSSTSSIDDEELYQAISNPNYYSSSSNDNNTKKYSPEELHQLIFENEDTIPPSTSSPISSSSSNDIETILANYNNKTFIEELYNDEQMKIKKMKEIRSARYREEQKQYLDIIEREMKVLNDTLLSSKDEDELDNSSNSSTTRKSKNKIQCSKCTTCMTNEEISIERKRGRTNPMKMICRSCQVNALEAKHNSPFLMGKVDGRTGSWYNYDAVDIDSRYRNNGNDNYYGDGGGGYGSGYGNSRGGRNNQQQQQQQQQQNTRQRSIKSNTRKPNVTGNKSSSHSSSSSGWTYIDVKKDRDNSATASRIRSRNDRLQPTSKQLMKQPMSFSSSNGSRMKPGAKNRENVNDPTVIPSKENNIKDKEHNLEELLDEIQRLKDVVYSYKVIIDTMQKKQNEESTEKMKRKRQQRSSSNDRYGRIQSNKKKQQPPDPNEFDDVPF